MKIPQITPLSLEKKLFPILTFLSNMLDPIGMCTSGFFASVGAATSSKSEFIMLTLYDYGDDVP